MKIRLNKGSDTKRKGAFLFLCMTCAVVGLGGTQTLCWYRLDEAAAGTLTTADSSIVNAVSGSQVPNGICYSIDSAKTLSQTGNIMPIYGEGFPHNSVVYDPITRRTYQNDRAMRFVKNGSSGALIDISNANNWIPAPSSMYTIEFFYKWEGSADANWVPLMGAFDGAGEEVWMFRLHTQHRFSLHATGSDGKTKQVDAGTKLDDGRWHHIAVRCTSGSRLDVYADYEWISEVKDVPLKTVEGGRFFIGSDPTSTYARFEGVVDEVRVTEGLLTPDQFLRFRNVADNVDAGVEVFIDFEEAEENWIGAMDRGTLDFNRACGSAVASLTLVGNSAVCTDKLPGSFTRKDFLSEEKNVNKKAVSFESNADSGKSSGCIVIDDSNDVIWGDGFTLEMDIKIDALNTVDDCFYIVCTPEVKLRILRASGALDMYGDGISGKQNWGAELCDGKWHHLALVYDKVSKSIALYSDYYLAYKAVADYDVSGAIEGHKMAISSGMWSLDGFNMSKGGIDNVRISRSILGARNFQTSSDTSDGVVAWLGFDGNLLSFVHPALLKGGSLGEFARGGVAKFSNMRRGSKLLDKQGTSLKDNVQSLLVQGGSARWSASAMIPSCDFTIEFFFKCAQPIANAGIIELSTSSSVNNPAWSLRVDSSATRPEVWCKAPTDVAVQFPGELSYFDGKWHHLAVSFESKTDSVEMRFYRDYELVKTQEVTGVLPEAVSGTLMIGESWSTERPFNGIIDEIRMHMGVVDAEKFLYSDRLGFAILFR